MNNVVILMHAGSATKETRGAISALVREKLLCRKQEGRVLRPVSEVKSLN